LAEGYQKSSQKGSLKGILKGILKSSGKGSRKRGERFGGKYRQKADSEKMPGETLVKTPGKNSGFDSFVSAPSRAGIGR